MCDFRLGKQMKNVLTFLYNNRTKVFKQLEIIEALYGKVTPSRKSSISRSIKVLMTNDLVASRKAYYSEQFDCYISQRVVFYITRKGELFVEETKKRSLRHFVAEGHRQGEGSSPKFK